MVEDLGGTRLLRRGRSLGGLRRGISFVDGRIFEICEQTRFNSIQSKDISLFLALFQICAKGRHPAGGRQPGNPFFRVRYAKK